MSCCLLHTGSICTRLVLDYSKHQSIMSLLSLTSSVSSAHQPSSTLCLSDHRPYRISGGHGPDPSCKRTPGPSGYWSGSVSPVAADSFYLEPAQRAGKPRPEAHHHRRKQRGDGVSLHTASAGSTKIQTYYFFSFWSILESVVFLFMKFSVY